MGRVFGWGIGCGMCGMTAWLASSPVQQWGLTEDTPPCPCCPGVAALCVCVCVSHSASSFSEAMRMGAEVYHNLKNLIKDKYGEWAGDLFVFWEESVLGGREEEGRTQRQQEQEHLPLSTLVERQQVGTYDCGWV